MGIFILGINGSPHKSGLCVGLLKKTLYQSKLEGAKVKLVHLRDYEKHFYNGELRTKIPREVASLFRLLRAADGIILATPVNWFNVSALMKNFIDQLTAFEWKSFALEGKVAGFIATEEEDGGMQAILDMVAPMSHLGLLIPPYATVFYNIKMSRRSEGQWMKKDARLLGGNIVKLAKIVKTNDKYFWDYKGLKKR